MIPVVQFVLMLGVVAWANKVVIRDESCLSVAKLMGEVVGRLEGGSLLTGREIAECLRGVRVRYGVVGRGGAGPGEGAGEAELRFENEILDGGVGRVGLVEDGDGELRRRKENIKPGLYD